MDSSYIPGVRKILPSDTFKIWKIGSNVRLDFSFVNMKGLAQKRREMTLIFRDGVNSNDIMKGADLILLNRDKEIAIDQFEELEIDEQIAIINEIMSTQPSYTDLKDIKVQSEPCKSFFGFEVFENINSYKSQRYKLNVNC